jgi:hypothetical protein
MRGHFLRASLAGAVASYDADAQAYITAVEAADEQSLEVAVKDAINNFVVGCKADGIWSAIKASCIMCGAHTIDGALVPLVGPAPTKINFVSGDYSRELGLLGNGSTKYLATNLTTAFVPLNDVHLAVFHAIPQAAASIPAGTVTSLSSSLHLGNGTVRCRSVTSSSALGITNGLQAISRNLSTAYTYRRGGITYTYNTNSDQLGSAPLGIFAAGDGSLHYPGRLSFWSYGESLTLDLLDARVSTLMTAIDAAIP